MNALRSHPRGIRHRNKSKSIVGLESEISLLWLTHFSGNYSMVVYEGGSVMSQARSLWRLELARTKWAGGFINWLHPMRIRHLTTGRYLGVKENNELHLVDRNEATTEISTFWLRQEKNDLKTAQKNDQKIDDKDLEVIGKPIIKYGDSTVIMQHCATCLWVSYKVNIFPHLFPWRSNFKNVKILFIWILFLSLTVVRN